MAQPSEEEIRKRAHQLWEQNGKPEGREDEFWHLAEQELRNEDKSSPLRTPDTLFRVGKLKGRFWDQLKGGLHSRRRSSGSCRRRGQGVHPD